MNLRCVAVSVAMTAVAGGGLLLSVGTAAARPFGLVNCSAQPEGTQVVTTCVNDDDAPGLATMDGVCTNMHILWPVLGYSVAPNSTQQFVEDCGPGGVPASWNVRGQALWQKRQQDARDEQDEQKRRQQQQLDDQSHRNRQRRLHSQDGL